MTHGLLVHNPYVYKGYYYDSDTGYYYLKSRYYDPRIHRFLSADKIDYLDPKSLSSLNLYVYCGDNPVMGYDPSGKWDWSKFWKISLLVIIATGVIAASILTGGGAGAAILVGGAAGGFFGGLSAASAGQDVISGITLGMLFGAVAGGIGAMSSTYASAVFQLFGVGTVQDVVSQIVLDKKNLLDVNLVQSFSAGALMALGAMASLSIPKGIQGNLGLSITEADIGLINGIFTGIIEAPIFGLNQYINNKIDYSFTLRDALKKGGR